MATTEWQPSFKKCFHTTVCVSSLPFVVQLSAHFLRVYYCCYRAFTLAWFWPTESIQISRKRTAKEKQGERRNCKCQAHVLPPPLHCAGTLPPFILPQRWSWIMHWARVQYTRSPLPLCSGVCVSVCVRRGGLIIKPASEVVDYEEERCLSTIFHLFFVSP